MSIAAIEIASVWKATDGRIIRVLEKSACFVVCEVLNATGGMRRKTRFAESNFGDFLMPHLVAVVPPQSIVKDEVTELRDSLANVLVLARIKWGNLDADANKVFEHAESLLAHTVL